MRKLADITVFEQLQSRPSKTVIAFNVSSDSMVDLITDKLVKLQGVDEANLNFAVDMISAMFGKQLDKVVGSWSRQTEADNKAYIQSIIDAILANPQVDKELARRVISEGIANWYTRFNPAPHSGGVKSGSLKKPDFRM